MRRSILSSRRPSVFPAFFMLLLALNRRSPIGYDRNGADGGPFVRAFVSDICTRSVRPARARHLLPTARRRRPKGASASTEGSVWTAPENFPFWGGRGRFRRPRRIFSPTSLRADDGDSDDGRAPDHTDDGKIPKPLARGREGNVDGDLSASAAAETSDDDDFIDPLLILPLATASAVLLLFLGVMYVEVTNPAMRFDVDLYMALDSVRELGDANGADPLEAQTILAYPKLSPAEQLVGALFRPQ